jgi:hypothetical protein
MDLVKQETYEYKGITIEISEAGIKEASDCMGIDILKLLSNAIDRIRSVTDEPKNFQVRCRISNPICEPEKCQFIIDVLRV